MPAATIIALTPASGAGPAQGLLAGLAEIREVRTRSDVAAACALHPGMVLIDMRLEAGNGPRPSAAFSALRPPPLIVLFDAHAAPSVLRRHLSGLAAGHTAAAPRLADLPGLLGISQEHLARALGVSARSIHRWLNGTEPRENPKLAQILALGRALRSRLAGPAAIRGYLRHPNPSLENQMPIEAVLRGDIAPVLADLQALAEGVYT